MVNYMITADSGCDLSLDFCKSRKIVPIHMKYIVDGEEFTDNMNYAENKAFYDRMREGKMPRTAQLNEAEYTEFWEPMLKEGYNILHFAMSSGISGTYANGVRAAEELMKQYPDRKICVIDTLMTASGNGLFAIEAANLRDSGADFNACCEWAEKNRRCVHACFTTDDITYLHRGGRVSKAGMIFSKALHIYPVMHVNENGELKVFAKARGTAGAWQTAAAHIAENCIDPQNQTLYVSDADNQEQGKKLGEFLKEKIGFKDVCYTKIGSIIGSHTGPGLLAVFFLGKERK